ncbi:MAG TPA: ribokinase [Tepidisphaeraceae bacterium]|nr:ribokinase [Tepidisphaeraceae bacterium]
MSRMPSGSWASGGRIPPGPVVVIGSINMDLVCRVQRLPGPGETSLGSELSTIPGGKGANQAVAAAKLGAEVHLIGRVGDDDFGARLINGLQQHKVHTEHVTVTEGTASGCALILVDKKGENSIVVAPGANGKLRPAEIDAAEGLLAHASVVVMQLEIPMETVQRAIAACRRLGVFVILDPAPVPSKGVPKEVFQVNMLTPNQKEAEALLPLRQMGRMRRKKRVDVKQIGTDLLARGPGVVVLKLGARGAMIQDQSGYIETVKGLKVGVVDTTAAGDAFTGAMAVALAEGKELREAAKFANAAGAACCKAFGAQPALPSREMVEKLMKK